MKKLSFLLLAIAFSIQLFAYPITPRPLRKLVIESEYIVWAHVSVVGSLKLKKYEDPWNSNYAKIIVMETLQGILKSDTLKIYFSGGMICPAPGVFFKGEDVLVFLDKREKMDGYEVHALSYGVKHGLKKQDYGIYKERIQEIQKIIESGQAKNYTECIVDWLVNCATEKCTRWEGVYELSPQSDFMSYYDRDDIIRRDIFLTPLQRSALFNVLLEIDTLDYADIPLADIVMGINDSLLLDFLKLRLTRVNKEYFWPAESIMQRIVYLTGNKELEELSKKFNDIYSYPDKAREEKIKLFLNFVDKMKAAKLRQVFTTQGNSSV